MKRRRKKWTHVTLLAMGMAALMAFSGIGNVTAKGLSEAQKEKEQLEQELKEAQENYQAQLKGYESYYVDENGKWDPERGKTQGGWKSDNKGKWYQNSDGTYPVNEWKMIDGKWFYFDEHGYMKTGWIYVDGQWYFLNSEGIMCTNQWIDNTYYVKNSGEMARNEWVDQNRYYVDENGEWVRNYA